MVTIKKTHVSGGHIYQIDDFENYVRELSSRGIVPPVAKFNVFISTENERLISESFRDWEGQIALLFKLSESTGIPYRLVSEASDD